jgi:hypothetical protein
VFWVISVYFNIRNTLQKSGTFLLGHPVYIEISVDVNVNIEVDVDINLDLYIETDIDVCIYVDVDIDIDIATTCITFISLTRHNICTVNIKNSKCPGPKR